jgi:DNA polymerase
MNGVSGRDAAFLQEMGIGPLWTMREMQDAQAVGQPADDAAAPPRPAVAQAPQPQAAAAPAPQPVYAGPSAPPIQRLPGADTAWPEPPAAPPATDEEIARMDWDELRAAVAGCTRCGLCKGGRKPVFGSGAQQAQWLVAAGAATAADEKEGQPLAGDPGKLLANMLAAAGHARGADTWITNLIKCRPTTANGGDRAPTADEAAACRPYLERELALSGAGTVVTLGQIAANALLGKPLQEPLAGTRGRVHALNGAALVATLHPGELLRRGADKALAWSDLCLAMAADAGPG